LPVVSKRSLEGVFIPSVYPKIKYLPINPPKQCKKEKIMSKEYTNDLLSQRVLVEEKMDGRSSMYISDKGEFRIFAEDLKYVHSLNYKVPARYAVFDIFDCNRHMFLCREHKEDVFNSLKKGTVRIYDQNPYNFFLASMITKGWFKLEEIPNLIGMSRYAYDPKKHDSIRMEGVVVKPDRELLMPEFKYLVGKCVRTDFSEKIIENYLTKNLELNEINPRVGYE